MKKLITLVVMTIAICSSCKSAEPVQAELFESGWLLEKVPATSEPIPVKSPMYLSFGHTSVIGYSGCVDFWVESKDTAYDRKMGSLRLPVGLDGLGCDDGKFADAYVDVLWRVRSYQSDGKTLTLLDASGKPLAIYRRDDAFIVNSGTG